MKVGRFIFFGAIALVAGGAACSIPDFKFRGETSGTGGASTTGGASASHSSASTTASSGASSSSSSSSSSSTTTSSSGGAGGSGGSCNVLHDGGGPCEYLPGKECGCGDGEKCSIADESTGLSRCILVGQNPLGPWQKCSTDADCGAGTFCDHPTSVCKPMCISAGDCPSQEALCQNALTTGGATIPGFKLCTAHCDPMASSTTCGANVACAYFPKTKEPDCAVTNGVGEGSSCSGPVDCADGAVCVTTKDILGNTVHVCERWCDPIDENNTSSFCKSASDSFDYCISDNLTLPYDGLTYGTCSP